VSVTVVLDTSAVLAYTKGSIAVGELLSIVADDGDTALVPAACLAEAYRRLVDDGDELLGVLASVPCVEVAALSADQAASVGVVARGATGIDLGHAAAEAVARHAQLATRNHAVMSRLVPVDWPVIEL
jgi:hypothetical protein